MKVGGTVTHICYVRDNQHDPVSSVTAVSGTVIRNGSDDVSIPVSVTQAPDLSYRAQFVVPTTYSEGDFVSIRIDAEHPAGKLISNTFDLGQILNTLAQPYTSVAKSFYFRNTEVGIISVPVASITVQPIIDGVDVAIPVTVTTLSDGGFYATFSISGYSFDNSVHLRVSAPVTVGSTTKTLVETLLMQPVVDTSATVPIYVTSQTIRVPSPPKLRVNT